MYSIKGFNPSTFIDWEGKIASVIYLPGCNFRCPMCHSSSLVLDSENLNDVPFENVEKFLVERKQWIDAVVIGGGEPTLHKNLCKLLTEIRKRDLLIKIDTNGSSPHVIRDLIDYNLVDYIAMDIKAPLNPQDYNKATGGYTDMDSIRESIAILLASSIDYEFRTTVVPTFISREDILSIAHDIGGARLYVLQQFNSKETLDQKLSDVTGYSPDKLNMMAKLAGEHVKECFVRGV